MSDRSPNDGESRPPEVPPESARAALLIAVFGFLVPLLLLIGITFIR